MRRWPAVLLGATALLGVASCSDDGEAEPAPAPRETTSTAVVDRSGIALAPVAGETTTTIREAGSARLVGMVRGPAGPAAGATVRIERFVAGREIRTDVTTGADGRFALEGVPGGRYRVRAFQPPTLAQVDGEIRFLADGEAHEFDLVMEEHTGLVVSSSSAPVPALVDSPVNLVVQVAQREVDGDGIIRTNPVVGVRVELRGLGRWVLRSSSSGSGTSTGSSGQRVAPAAITDGAGRARWELRCVAEGEPGLAVGVPVRSSVAATQPPATAAPQVTMETVPLDLPACVEAPRPTTSTSGASTTTTLDDDG